MRAKRAIILLGSMFLLAPSLGRAEQDSPPVSPLAVLAFGRCARPELAGATRTVRRELQTRGGLEILDEETTAAPAIPTRPSEEQVLGALERGRSLFLESNAALAEQTVRASLPEIDRLPLGPVRRKAWSDARTLLARLLQITDQPALAEDVFLDILKVQETFTLSNLEHPPSAIALLDRARSRLAGMLRFRLTIASPTPGAMVFINGFAAGPTPLERHLAAGTYRIEVLEGERTSLQHQLSLSAPTSLVIDPAHAGHFQPGHGPCYEAENARPQRLSAARAIAGALDIDQIIAVRIEEVGAEEHLTAALIEVRSDRELREGRVPLDEPTELVRLAQFIATGEGLSGKSILTPSPLGTSSHGHKTSDAWALSRIGAYSLAATTAVFGGLALHQHLRSSEIQSEISNLVVPGTGAIAQGDQGLYQKLQSDLSDAKATRNGCAIAAGAAAIGSGVLFFISAGTDSSSETRTGLRASLMVAGTF